MQFGNISVQVCPADNLDVGLQSTAINGEINIHSVMMCGNYDGRRLSYASLTQGIDVGSVPMNIVIIVFNELWIFLHNLISNLTLSQGLCCGTPDTAST